MPMSETQKPVGCALLDHRLCPLYRRAESYKEAVDDAQEIIQELQAKIEKLEKQIEVLKARLTA